MGQVVHLKTKISPRFLDRWCLADCNRDRMDFADQLQIAAFRARIRRMSEEARNAKRLGIMIRIIPGPEAA